MTVLLSQSTSWLWGSQLELAEVINRLAEVCWLRGSVSVGGLYGAGVCMVQSLSDYWQRLSGSRGAGMQTEDQ